METSEARTATPLEVFRATCEAAAIPAGAHRLDVFLALPESQQDEIWLELASSQLIDERVTA